MRQAHRHTIAQDEKTSIMYKSPELPQSQAPREIVPIGDVEEGIVRAIRRKTAVTNTLKVTEVQGCETALHRRRMASPDVFTTDVVQEYISRFMRARVAGTSSVSQQPSDGRHRPVVPSTHARPVQASPTDRTVHQAVCPKGPTSGGTSRCV